MTTNEMMKVEARKTGKGQSRGYRVEKKIPAVIYGPKTENKNCMLDEIFVLKHSNSKHKSTIFMTQSDDKSLSSMKVMLKKIEIHPATHRPVHVDLYALDMTAKIKVNVNIDFQGEPVGVKEEGGLLQTVLTAVEIEVNPTEIPENIPVDISGLKLNESMHVSDLSLPESCTLITAAERTICSVAQPKKEEEPAADAATEGEAPAAGSEAAPAGDAPAAEGGE